MVRRSPTNSLCAGLIVAVSISGGGGGGGSGKTSASARLPPVSTQVEFSNVSALSGAIVEHQVSTPSPSHADLIARGVAAADFDADGYIDIYVVGGNGSTPNRLYRSNGNGVRPSGESTILTNVSANQLLVIEETN